MVRRHEVKGHWRKTSRGTARPVRPHTRGTANVFPADAPLFDTVKLYRGEGGPVFEARLRQRGVNAFVQSGIDPRFPDVDPRKIYIVRSPPDYAERQWAHVMAHEAMHHVVRNAGITPREETVGLDVMYRRRKLQTRHKTLRGGI